jgi:hypothetical protein
VLAQGRRAGKLTSLLLDYRHSLRFLFSLAVEEDAIQSGMTKLPLKQGFRFFTFDTILIVASSAKTGSSWELGLKVIFMDKARAIRLQRYIDQNGDSRVLTNTETDREQESRSATNGSSSARETHRKRQRASMMRRRSGTSKRFLAALELPQLLFLSRSI